MSGPDQFSATIVQSIAARHGSLIDTSRRWATSRPASLPVLDAGTGG